MCGSNDNQPFFDNVSKACAFSGVNIFNMKRWLLKSKICGIKNNKSNFREISAVGLIYKKGYLKDLCLPLLFNFFINDMFYFTEYGTLYNYADDNT